jgi:hypothetical protein
MPVIPKPPMTNGERQRKFQRSHPGYDARRKSRERAMEKRARAQFAELWAALIKAAEAAEAAKAAASAAPLALPAPVEMPLLPAINDLNILVAEARAVAA